MITLNGDIINIYNCVQHLGCDVGDIDSNWKVINKAICELHLKTKCLNLVVAVALLEIFSFVPLYFTVEFITRIY